MRSTMNDRRRADFAMSLARKMYGGTAARKLGRRACTLGQRLEAILAGARACSAMALFLHVPSFNEYCRLFEVDDAAQEAARVFRRRANNCVYAARRRGSNLRRTRLDVIARLFRTGPSDALAEWHAHVIACESNNI